MTRKGKSVIPRMDPMTRLTMAEFAALLGVSYGTVARGVRCKEIPAHKIGGAVRIFWGEAMAATLSASAAYRNRRAS